MTGWSKAVFTVFMALDKRIKRHIWAKEHRFLVTQVPQLRAVCAKEIREEGLALSEETEQGIYFTGRIEDAYRAHLMLRSASRIWLCLESFKAGAREELFRRAAALPWELLLNPRIPLDISARVRHSRLEHEGETAETLTAAIQRRFSEAGGNSPKEKAAGDESPSQRLRVIVENNRVELRVDLSGEHLHKRGYRLRQGAAPLRESLAAGIILWALEIRRKRHPEAAWPERIHDPFCGSGTIPIEAEMLLRGIGPGAEREFLFMQQPHFRAAAFGHLRKKAAQPSGQPPACRVGGSDSSPEMLEIARQNCAAAGLEIGFDYADALGASLDRIFSNGTLIICNPPYGERLAEGGVLLFRRIFARIQETGCSGVVILPRALEAKLPHDGFTRKLSFTNGGIPVSAVYLD